MKKIKSDRAKAYIRQHTFDCENCDTIERHMWSSDARQAVRYAEQDAEDRAVEAFKLVFKGFVADGLADNIAEVDFRRLLKGGQSDGN